MLLRTIFDLAVTFILPHLLGRCVSILECFAVETTVINAINDQMNSFLLLEMNSKMKLSLLCKHSQCHCDSKCCVALEKCGS